MLWLYALISVSMISLVSLLSVLCIRVNEKTLDTVKFYLISLATGAMLGNAFIHLVPESFEKAASDVHVWMPMLAGFMGCFLVHKVLRIRCHHSTGGHCSSGHDEHGHTGHIHPTGWMSIVSHGIDNFVDGALIGSAYLVSIPTGIATTVAIVLHEIPMELSGFGILLHSGFKRWTAIFVNFSSGLVAMTATILTLLLGQKFQEVSLVLTPIAAGTVIYIVATGLIPQLQDETDSRRSLKQMLMILLGLTLMGLAKFIDPS